MRTYYCFVMHHNWYYRSQKATKYQDLEVSSRHNDQSTFTKRVNSTDILIGRQTRARARYLSVGVGRRNVPSEPSKRGCEYLKNVTLHMQKAQN